MYRIQMFFATDVGSAAGWSETWYGPGGLTTPSGMTNLLGPNRDAAPGTPVGARLDLLHPEYALKEVRLTSMQVLRLTDVQSFSSTNSNSPQNPNGVGRFPTSPPDGTTTAEAPWTRLLVRQNVRGSASRRIQKMGGLPKKVVTDTYDYNPTPTWAQRWQDFGAAWVLGNVTPCARYRQLSPLPPLPPEPVDSVVVNPDAQSITVNFPVGSVPLIGVGDYFTLSGVEDCFPINHIWRCRRIAPGALALITYPGRNTLYGTPSGNNIGVRRIQFPDDRLITSLSPERGAKVDTGRPFNLLVGRGKPVTLRQPRG